MKRAIVIIAVVAVAVTLSVGAYAHYEGRGWGMYGSRGGMYGHGWRGGRGPAAGWNAAPESCPCGGYGPGNVARPGWNVPSQSGTTPQIITEDKAKEAAETYIKQYLPGYTVDKIEKDSWRPLYFVTVKGENNAELQLVLHGFDGRVMHFFPKTVETPAE